MAVARAPAPGGGPALLLSGAFWGFWHAPLILLGYNFGEPNPLGLAMMIVGSMLIGVIIGWTRLHTGSVWPAVLAHGAFNASAGMGALFPDLDALLVREPDVFEALVRSRLAQHEAEERARQAQERRAEAPRQERAGMRHVAAAIIPLAPAYRAAGRCRSDRAARGRRGRRPAG